ncbi:MAG TPA: hypothetical protein VHF69_10140 [Candidatus Synoicihabitans sp.]|nr:hypothetical protein [Candidatus Synoicihabitans sp.]
MNLPPFLAIVAVLAALGALFGFVKVLQARATIDSEVARKLVHIGMGIVCLSFPWLFSEQWPVWVLAGLAVGSLTLLRLIPAVKAQLGDVLHGVKRASLGEMYFPLAVAAVFSLSQGEPLRFMVPVALLTFADAAGALVGKRWGRHRFETLEGRKSVEGSLAVGLVSAAIVAAALLVRGDTLTHALLVAVIMGLFGALMEAIAWRGLDNAFLPLAAFAQLTVYLDIPTAPLVARLLVLVSLTVLAILWRRGAIINGGARLGAALALFFFWAVGGWPWLIAPALLLASYVRLMPTIPGGVPRHNLLAVLCVGSAALPWAVAHAMQPQAGWLWPYTVGLTAQQAIIAAVRCAQARGGWASWRCAAVGVAQAVLVQLALGYSLAIGRLLTLAELLTGASAVVLGLAAFLVVERQLRQPDDLNARWWKQGATALGAGACAMLATLSLLP